LNAPEYDEPCPAPECRVEIGKGCAVTPTLDLEPIENRAMVVRSEDRPHLVEGHDRKLAEPVPAEMIADQHGPPLATVGGVTEIGHIGDDPGDDDAIDLEVGVRERGRFFLELLAFLAGVNKRECGDQHEDTSLFG